MSDKHFTDHNHNDLTSINNVPLLDKYYNIETIEKFFRENDIFEHRAKDFVIAMPPPNITGSLHIGHALVNTIQDAVLRYQHINGSNPVWLVGTDHAGIAGQLMLEQYLIANNINTNSVEEKISYMKQWRAEKESAIHAQTREMYLNIDWNNGRFTLDPAFHSAVLDTFIKLFNEGLIYKSNRIVRWDIKLQTAISDLEVESCAAQGNMYYIYYPGVDCEGIIIATTRPETLFADTAIAVNISDNRYKHLIGCKVKVPIIDRIIPIIGDHRISQDVGTGALKVTPAHDELDWQIGITHNLEVIQVIDKFGKIMFGPLAGEDRNEARQKTADLLKELDLLKNVQIVDQCLPYGSRSKSLLEMIPTMQWFCNMEQMAASALQKLDQIEIYPNTRANLLKSWLENIEPWCISRQLWWGHRIPVWISQEGKFFAAKTENEAHQAAELYYGQSVTLVQETDVLDTWFSSAIWTVATDRESKVTDLLVTGYDILNAWVARMIMLSIFLTNDIPFKKVLLTGLVRDKHGAKMSKTIGNVINPSDLIAKYGGDAVRLWLVENALPGHDIPLALNQLEAKQMFLTKIWNIGRLCISRHCSSDWPAQVTMKWNIYWINRMRHFEEQIRLCWSNYRFAELIDIIYHGIWDEFANCYLEGAKAIWNDEIAAVAGASFCTWLQWLHPIIPAITTTLFGYFSKNSIKEYQVILPNVESQNEPAEWIEFAAALRQLSHITGVRQFYIQANQLCDLKIISALSNLQLDIIDTQIPIVDLIFGKVYFEVSQEVIHKMSVIKNNYQFEQSQLRQRQIHFNERTPSDVISKTAARIGALSDQIEYLERLQSLF